MKIRSTLTALGVATLLTGCNTLLDTFTISEAQVKQLSEEACQQYDAQSKVAGTSSKYTKRLNKIAKNLGNSTTTGVPLTYKVYLTEDVNAWAMANGCVRVYSGLMDKMTDDEVQGVLGHEIGHVALGHSTKAMQTAYATTMARDAISAYGGSKAAELTQSQLGDLAENLINSQFSQSQEREADNYSFDLLKSKKLNTMALATAFDKLAAGGRNSNIFSSHPDAQDRAQNIRDRIAKEGK
jgi:putative metalloprotease